MAAGYADIDSPFHPVHRTPLPCWLCSFFKAARHSAELQNPLLGCTKNNPHVLRFLAACLTLSSDLLVGVYHIALNRRESHTEAGCLGAEAVGGSDRDTDTEKRKSHHKAIC